MIERYPRWQKANIKKLMLERRVLLLSGPRQCGKTTLARELESNETEYRTLDDGTLRELSCDKELSSGLTFTTVSGHIKLVTI